MDTLLPWLGDGTAESRVHRRTPTCSVETVPLSRPLQDHLVSPPCFCQPCCGLAILHLNIPQFALKLVLVTARTSSVLRDFKIIFVERFLPLNSVALRKGFGGQRPWLLFSSMAAKLYVLGHLGLPEALFSGKQEQLLASQGCCGG